MVVSRVALSLLLGPLLCLLWNAVCAQLSDARSLGQQGSFSCGRIASTPPSLVVNVLHRWSLSVRASGTSPSFPCLSSCLWSPCCGRRVSCHCPSSRTTCRHKALQASSTRQAADLHWCVPAAQAASIPHSHSYSGLGLRAQPLFGAANLSHALGRAAWQNHTGDVPVAGTHSTPRQPPPSPQ